MKYNSKNKDLSKSESFFGSNFNQTNNSTNDINKQSFSNINPILKEEDKYHYLCPKCYNFPLIEFFKNKKYIKFTCSCYNNKKILIKDLFDESNNYITINNLSCSSILSSNIIKDNEEGLICKEHHEYFKYFCKTCLINICDECKIYYHDDFPHEIIELEYNNKIDNEKLDKIITIINSINIDESNIDENIKFVQINYNFFEKVTKDEENEFYKFLRIIINDYKNYPNFIHYYNIQNIFYFFNLNNNRSKDNINNNIKEYYEKEEITIKYIKNNSNINLFNENFVNNNKDKIYLEIEGKKYELKSQYKFEKNENIITIKLIIKEEIFEIDMSEMFANCNNLIYINGISKLKKTKILSKYKMFYNCTSLISIPDINIWKIELDINDYLMFYNCISLIYFHNPVTEKTKNIYINNYIDIGIIITKYYQNGKEIILKTNIEKNEKIINLYENKLNI